MKAKAKRRRRSALYCVAALIAFSMLAAPCFASPTWQTDGVPVCAAPGRQVGRAFGKNPIWGLSSDGPRIVADGNRGAYVAFENGTDGSTFANSINVQRIDRDGRIYTGWDEDGVTVTRISGNEPDEFQSCPEIIEFEGDVIATWTQRRPDQSLETRAQRVSKDGERLWGDGGVLVSSEQQALHFISFPEILRFDDRVAIAWINEFTHSYYNHRMYVQFLDGGGQAYLQQGGIPVGPRGVCGFGEFSMIKPAQEILLIAWQEYEPNNSFFNIRAQMVTLEGELLCSRNGISVCSARSSQISPQVVNDGPPGSGGWTGGTIFWEDWRNENMDVYAQRVGIRDLEEGGRTIWRNDGVLIAGTSDEEFNVEAMNNIDGPAGTVVTWIRHNIWTPNQMPCDIYAQRLDINGNRVWPDDVLICDAPDDQVDQEIVAADGNGTAVITWMDRRNGVPNEDIYASVIDVHGHLAWPSEESGIPVCTAEHRQGEPELAMTEEGAGIITWDDDRSNGLIDTDVDIYANRICLLLPPYIASVSPKSGLNLSSNLRMTIRGGNLGNVDEVELQSMDSTGDASARRIIRASNVQVISTNEVTCRFDLRRARTGRYIVVVRSISMQQEYWKWNAFQVVSLPPEVIPMSTPIPRSP